MSPQVLAEDFGIDQQSEIDRLEMIVQCRLSGRVRDFRLLPRPDGLILQGSAATYHAKQLAQHAIMAATPRPILVNDIEVRSLCSSQSAPSQA